MAAGSTILRVGLCLVVIGGLVSVIAYPAWSSLNASLQRDCWGAVEASSCPSVALSAGFWLPITVEALGLFAAGLVTAFVGFSMDYRARRGVGF